MGWIGTKDRSGHLVALNPTEEKQYTEKERRKGRGRRKYEKKLARQLSKKSFVGTYWINSS